MVTDISHHCRRLIPMLCLYLLINVFLYFVHLWFFILYFDDISLLNTFDSSFCTLFSLLTINTTALFSNMPNTAYLRSDSALLFCLPYFSKLTAAIFIHHTTVLLLIWFTLFWSICIFHISLDSSLNYLTSLYSLQ